ncbi:MAG: peptide-methionine (S)-S-oxide reductase [Bacteroidetes bacterium]|nr:MAG: peptide-methionine (S)-S-oxide reductase [Bacteroidota bacterium]MBL1144496.1 peptide-methionine (S)-S-oxide reductase [Bacteroidota bacterium]NOG57291.1 peptide-methionine (S)-S-oxide reductase MsrA [Bacteroidota bacterium]
MKKYLIICLSVCYSVVSCANSNEENKTKKTQQTVELQNPNLKAAYFASGCFWCVEAVFQSVKGVKDAVSGYAGGESKNPTYEQVSSGNSKHAEAVKVIYDPLQIDYETLLKVFFGSHDPTTLHRQGPDRGPQYRSIAFYQTDAEKKMIENYISTLEKNKSFSAPIVTEIKKFDVFWEAEEYHQEYESLHPENPYVQSVSIPRLNRFKAKFPELQKENH